MSSNERIGDLLVKRGKLLRATAEAVAAQCAQAPVRFASLLVEQGACPEPDVLQAIAELNGLPAVLIQRVRPHRAAVAKVPKDVAQRLGVLPLRLDGEQLHVAMTDPQDRAARDELSFGTGCQILPYVALYGPLHARVARIYGPNSSGETSETPADSLPLVSPSRPELRVREPVPAPVTPTTPAAAPTPAHAPLVKADDGVIVVERKGSADVILVVEDESVSRELILSALKTTGCTLVATADGLSALKLLKSREPILVVCDAVLPEVHGFEICRKIKESKRFGKTPVLLVSASYKGWETARAIKETYKADDFLEKPFAVQTLRARVETLLRNSPAARAAAQHQAQFEAPYLAGMEALGKGDLDAALKRLREAEQNDPFSAKVQYAMGQTFEKHKRPFQAVYHYERASQLDPELFVALRTLAQLYNELGFTQKSTQAWERAEKCAPSPEVRQQIHDYLVKTT